MKRILTFLSCLAALLCGGSARAQASAKPDPQHIVGCYISLGTWNLPQVSAEFSELSASGVNFVIDYALVWPEDPAQQDLFNAYLAMAGREGITVAYCLFNALEGATPRASSKQLQRALHEVETLRDRPQIGAWYVHDEVLPSLSGVDGTEKYCLSLEQMEQLYRDIRRLDDSRPQICVWNQLPDCAEMNRRFSNSHFPHGKPDWISQDGEFETAMRRMVHNSCDWVMVDCYPVGAPWLEDGESPSAITAEVGALVGRAAQLRSPEQPLFLVYQSFDWKMYGRGHRNAGFPSLEQMRNMVQSGLEAGADNVIAYSWFDLTRKLDGKSPAGQARCMADLKTILAELGRQR